MMLSDVVFVTKSLVIQGNRYWTLRFCKGACLLTILRNVFFQIEMVVQYCKTYTGRADGETGFTDRTNGTVREDIYGS